MKRIFSKTCLLVTLLVVLFLLMSASPAFAQSTTFTYQGRLQDGGTHANGSYDLQLTLWDASSGGTQQPQPSPVTVTRTSVLVTSGIFTVPLDFGGIAFPGDDRFLEIGVLPLGSGSFTILSPRQQTTATPYAIRSAKATTADQGTTATRATNAPNATNATTATKATQLGGVAASQYVVTSDSRLTDSRAPTAGSANYIQNNPASSQTNSNFNISGNGTAGVTLSSNFINATTQYNLGTRRVLSTPPTNNLFVGLSAGANNSSGTDNTFSGSNAGNNNTAGSANSFFGSGAGLRNTTGERNSYFCSLAGAAFLNFHSYTGSDNSFFGSSAGSVNSTGANNSFFGSGAGVNNTTGSSNTLIGNGANVSAGNLTNATAIGANASVTQSNSLVLGNNANVGIGTSTALASRLNVYGSDTVGCNAATIGFGAPIGIFCASALQLTTHYPNSSNLILGSNPSAGDVTRVSGKGEVCRGGMVGNGNFDD